MSQWAASLLAVFAVARAAVLVGRELPASPWAPLVYAWQDAAVVLGFLAFATVVRREWAVRVVYGALVLLAAINVPVVRVLSSPLTTPMLRAARGELADSIRHHATAPNFASLAVVLLAGVLVPVLVARIPPVGARLRRAAVGALAAVPVLGWVGASRVDTAGLERHPLLALVRTALPRVRGDAAEPADADWRGSPFSGEAGAGTTALATATATTATTAAAAEDLTHLRGVASGRNVLLVVLESAGARYLRPYGATEDPMPAVTALAEQAIVFEHAYAVYPESVKGLVALLASRYPAFDVPAERHAVIASPSLATVLDSAGYATALFHSGRFMYLGMEELVARAGFALREDAGAIGGNVNSSFGIDEAATVQRILRWVDGLPRGARFFAAWLPIAGHHPYAHVEPGPFPEAEDVGRYRNALFEGDRALGELLDGLRARGLDRSTVVVALGDHGEAFGQHEGNYGHTLALYEENVRVPLVIAMPGAERAIAPVTHSAAIRVRRAASLLDVAPTVLDLLGLRAPGAFQGESLLAPRARMALFFTDYSLGLLGLRDGCTKFIHELESGRSRMFDLCRDPDERVDVAPRFADRAARYRARLRAWSAAQAAQVARLTRGTRDAERGSIRP